MNISLVFIKPNHHHHHHPAPSIPYPRHSSLISLTFQSKLLDNFVASEWCLQTIILWGGPTLSNCQSKHWWEQTTWCLTQLNFISICPSLGQPRTDLDRPGGTDGTCTLCKIKFMILRITIVPFHHIVISLCVLRNIIIIIILFTIIYTIFHICKDYCAYREPLILDQQPGDTINHWSTMAVDEIKYET